MNDTKSLLHDAKQLLAAAENELGLNPPLAGELLETCIQVAEATSDGTSRARAIYLLARVSLIDGNAERALDLIEESRLAWVALDRPHQACRTSLGRMNVLDELGRHAEAVTVGDHLLQELGAIHGGETNGDLTWIRAAASENLGAALGSMGQHQRAITASVQAETAYQRLGLVPDVARVRANRGIELIEMGCPSDGVAVLEAAAELFKAEGDELSLAKCLAQKGDGETALGQHSAALATLERARAMFEHIGARVELARVCVTLASLYLELNLTEEAHSLATTARGAFDEMGLEHDCARASWHVAMCDVRLGRLEDAVRNCEYAVDAFNEVGDAAMAARAQLTLSEGLFALGDDATALRCAKAVVATLRLSERPGLLAISLLWLSFLLQDDHGRCDALLDEASRTAGDLHLPELTFLVTHRTGCLRLAQGRRNEARRLLEEAVRIADSLHGAIRQSSLRTGFLLRRARAHTDLIRLLLASGDPDDELAAFRVGNRSKAIGHEQWNVFTHRRSAERHTGVQPDLTDQLSHSVVSALGELHAAYDRLIVCESKNSVERQEARARIEVLERTISLARLRLAPPEIEQPRPTSRDSWGDVDQTFAIAYQVLEDEVVAFSWSANHLTVHRDLCSIRHVHRLLEDLAIHWKRQRLAMEVGLDADITLLHATRETLQGLYMALLAPITALHFAHLSVSQPDADELVISMASELADVPFHALFDGARYFGQLVNVVITGPLGAQDPFGSSEDPCRPVVRFGRPCAALVMSTADPSLPGATSEADSVARLLGVAPVLGSDATFERFAERAPHCRIVHIAGHGMHRTSRPWFSGLRLADRWMSPFDLLSVDLRGVLAVLSGCETGLHVSRGAGDEPIGLARGFLAAGASAVVVTLWQVSDRSTEIFMREFYQCLSSGTDASQALRDARLSVAERFPHPFHWAAFVLLRNDDTTSPSRTNNVPAEVEAVTTQNARRKANA